MVPDAGGPDVFCATRLNDTIAAGDRLEYDLVPNEGRSAHKAGNVTILPRAAVGAAAPRLTAAPVPAAVKPVAEKPAPRWSSAEAARDADALEFFYEGDASKLEPRFVLQQLRCGGTPQLLTLMGRGFPTRTDFDALSERYR